MRAFLTTPASLPLLPLLPLLLLGGLGAGAGGCQPREVAVTYDQPGCTDYDFNDPAPEDFTVQIDAGQDVTAAHTNLLRACSDAFEPEVAIEDRVVEIREAWVEGEGGSDCETCFSPEILIEGLPRGRYELRWTLEGDTFPALVEEFRIE